MLPTDDPERRAYTLRGRLQGLDDARSIIMRTVGAVEPDELSDVQAVLAYARACAALVRGLSDLGDESAAELRLIADELGLQRFGDPAGT